MTRHDRPHPAHGERRSQRRVPAAHVPLLSAQLSGGARVSLLDVSQGGVRLETTRHMRPGQRVSVRFSVDDRVVIIAAAVVRAAVVHVHPDEVRYETGLRLTEDLSCDALDIALVERRGGVADAPEQVEEEPAADLIFEPAAGHEAEIGVAGKGWWLASRRRRLRVLDRSTSP